VKIPALGGELRFRKARGKGIAREHQPLSIRLRSGGERLQPDPRRPRRTLKNLFQEAGVPPWERERLPLLFSGDDLVWVPGLDRRAIPGARGFIGAGAEWSTRARVGLPKRAPDECARLVAVEGRAFFQLGGVLEERQEQLALVGWARSVKLEAPISRQAARTSAQNGSVRVKLRSAALKSKSLMRS